MISEATSRAEIPFDTPGLVVVDFYTNDCRFCDMLNAVLEEVEFAVPFVPIVKVNCAEVSGLSDEFDVRMFPTIKLFKDGREMQTLVGFQPSESLQAAIGEHLY